MQAIMTSHFQMGGVILQVFRFAVHCVLVIIALVLVLFWGAILHIATVDLKLFLIFNCALIVPPVVYLIFHSSFLSPHLVIGVSAQPTLETGDCILFNRLAYGFKPPAMKKQIVSWSKPQRGDMVAFKPLNSKNWNLLLKRVVGVPGDTVTFTNGVLTVNDVLAKEQLIDDRVSFDYVGPDENIDDYNIYMESGFSQFPHCIMRKKYGGMTERETQSWVVGPHKLLLVGDNRDNSLDGRSWGLIDEDRIYGRAFFILCSIRFVPGTRRVSKYKNGRRWFQFVRN